MLKFKLAFLFLLSFSGLFCQTGLSPKIASYEIDLVLDVDDKKVRADQKLFWKNPSETPVSELQFHIYYNAFKNTESTFMKDRGVFEGLLSDALAKGCGWAKTEILEMIDEDGNDLVDNMTYIQPDDDNTADQTVLRVVLDKPVQPGEIDTFQMKWVANVPKIMPRTGYNKDYYFMVQWFPKVGVYELAGSRYAEQDQWNCHQYHSTGEYYSDFGDYKVSIDVPADYVVGASGLLKEKNENGDRAVWTYEVEDVIDFAWTTSPHYSVLKDEWKDVQIKLLTYSNHEHCAPRFFQSMKNVLEFMDEHVGEYPYPSITIVDPPIHGLYTGGMEYPTLISALSFCFFPQGVRTPEILVTHEFIHQYFMQMVATHEVEEPWMDEGFTTYFESRVMNKYYGEYNSTIEFAGIKVGNAEFNRIEYLSSSNPKIAAGNTKSWEYKHGGYGTIAYNKTGMWLKTLEGLIGVETMDELMKTYFERWKFKHPCGRDFTSIVNEVVKKNHGDKFGENMDWFFDQVLYGTVECDYAIQSITNGKSVHPAGFVDDEDCIPLDVKKLKPGYTSKLVLNRLGEMQLPVEVQINFEDGKSIMENWDGTDRSTEFVYQGDNKIVSAIIDPEKKIDMDKNFLNNSMAIEVQETGVRKYFINFLLAAQEALQSITALI